jgi:hypothetical protein
MALFLILAVPGAYLLFLSFEGVELEDNVRSILLSLRMVVLSLPIYVAFFFIRRALPVEYDTGSLYLRHLLFDVLLFLIPSITTLFFLRMFPQYKNELVQFIGRYSVITGIWFIPGILDAVLLFGDYDGYVLFLRPILRIAVSVILAVGLDSSPSADTAVRWSRYGVTFALPLLVPLIPMFYYLHQPLAAYSGCGIIVLSTVSFYIFCRQTYRRRGAPPQSSSLEETIHDGCLDE